MWDNYAQWYSLLNSKYPIVLVLTFFFRLIMQRVVPWWSFMFSFQIKGCLSNIFCLLCPIWFFTLEYDGTCLVHRNTWLVINQTMGKWEIELAFSLLQRVNPKYCIFSRSLADWKFNLEVPTSQAFKSSLTYPNNCKHKRMLFPFAFGFLDDGFCTRIRKSQNPMSTLILTTTKSLWMTV